MNNQNETFEDFKESFKILLVRRYNWSVTNASIMTHLRLLRPLVKDYPLRCPTTKSLT